MHMRRVLHGALFLCAFGAVAYVSSISFPDSGQHAAVVHAEPLFVVGEQQPAVSAKAWLVFDMKTGEVLASHNSDEVLPIASVTKLMTALVARETLPLDATTTVSAHAIATEGRAGRLEAGETIVVSELLFPLLLESSNDAAEALAEVSGRTAFLLAMNETADRLSLTATKFEDPHGISPNNVSSAHDLSLLVRHLYKQDRHIFDITTLPQYVGVAHDWMNNDPLVGSEGYQGGKHGFTPEAGRTFAGVWEQELKEGGTRPIGIVLLESDNLKNDAHALRTFAREQIAYTLR